MLVDLIGDYPQTVVGGPGADCLNFRGGVDGAGWIRGRDEYEHRRSGRPSCFQLFDGCAVARRFVGGNLHWDTARKGDRLRIGRPIGRGEQHLIARIQQGCEGVVESLLAAIRDKHLIGSDLPSRIAERLLGDRLLQCR